MVIDDDILLHLYHLLNNDSKTATIRRALTWIITQIDRAVESKIENIRQRKPGAIIAGEPKIIWIEMFNKMNGVSEILKMRGIFNELVNEIMAGKEQHYVMNVNRAMDDSNHFDQFNQINSYGITRFWQQVDYQLESFDKKRITLKPEQPDHQSTKQYHHRQQYYSDQQQPEVYYEETSNDIHYQY